MIYTSTGRAIGGSSHGRWLTALKDAPVTAVAPGGRRGRYLPAKIKLEGWKVAFPVWVHESMWRVGEPIVPARLLPNYTAPMRESCLLPIRGLR